MKIPILRKINNEFHVENDFEFYLENHIFHDPYTFEPIKRISFTYSPSIPSANISDEVYAEYLGEKLKQDFKNALILNNIKRKTYNNELFEGLDVEKKEMFSNLFDYVRWYVSINNKYYRIFEFIFVILIRKYKDKNNYVLSEINILIEEIYTSFNNYIKGFSEINDYETLFVSLFLNMKKDSNIDI